MRVPDPRKEPTQMARTGGRDRQTRSVHTEGRYSAVTRDEAWAHVRTRTNLKNITLSGSQTLKAPRCVTPFTRNVQGQRADRWVPGAGRGGVRSDRSWGRGLPCGDESVPNSTEALVARYCECTKRH